MTSKESDHWSDYWSRGCLTSLPQDFAENYDGEVEEFWADAFSRVPANGAVLDLCTGNGAIALLAAGYSRSTGTSYSVTAVDAARIHPGALAEQFPGQAELLKDIRFIPNTPVEELTLPGDQFDLVTSQYGLEYCDWQLAAKAVMRYLKPGGRMVMVCHSATSDILAFMEQERREYALLESLGLFESTSAFLQERLDDAQFRTRLNSMCIALGKQALHRPSPLFDSVLNMAGGVFGMGVDELAARKPVLGNYHAQMQHGLNRLEDLLRVNRGIGANPEWYRVFEVAGLKCSGTGELRYRGTHHAGVFFRFEKPDNIPQRTPAPEGQSIAG